MPVLVLDLDRGAVVKGLVEPGLVPPVHPLEGSDLNLKNVFPSMVIDQRECLMVCVWVPDPHKEMDQNDYCGETRSG